MGAAEDTAKTFSHISTGLGLASQPAYFCTKLAPAKKAWPKPDLLKLKTEH